MRGKDLDRRVFTYLVEVKLQVRMSHSFDTQLRPNFRNYDRNQQRKSISKPFIIGYFSVDQNRLFIPDESNCKYLKLPPKDEPIRFNLNEGYELVQHKPESANKEKLDHILKFILLNLKKLVAVNANRKSADKFLNFDIICFRGKLRMLMCTPYEFRDGWTLIATKWKGNIYLCELKTEKDVLKQQTETEQSKKICSYGFKFEQFVMSGKLGWLKISNSIIQFILFVDSPAAEPITSTPVLEAEEFCCMFTTKLENTRILYGAEMDGIESDTAVDLSTSNLNDLKFTEVKVRMKPSNQRQVENFHRFKTRNWWCQSYLTNVPKIVVGLRTESGIVDQLESINVESMPRMYEVRILCKSKPSTFV